MATWTSLLANWANKALSVARMNAYLGSGGNLDYLLLRTKRVIAETGGTLTISSGAVTAAPVDGYGRYPIDTQAAANTDDLDTINGGADGDIVYLLAANVARIIKLTTAGNISLPPAPYNICLSSTVELGFRYDSAASKWRLLCVFDPNLELWQNKSGGSVAANDLVAFDNTNAQSFITTTLQANQRAFAVVADASIADTAWGWIQRRGLRTINVQGNVSIGQALFASTTIKRAVAIGGAKAPGFLGYAVTAYAGGGAGTVTADFNPDFSIGGAATPLVEGSGVRINGASANIVCGSNINRAVLAIVLGENQAGAQVAISSAPTIGGSAMTLLYTFQPLTTRCIYVYGLTGTGTGNQAAVGATVTGGTSPNCVTHFAACSGVLQSGTYYTVAQQASGTSTAPAVADTVLTVPDLAICVFFKYDANVDATGIITGHPATSTTLQQQYYDSGTSNYHLSESDSFTVTATSMTPTWTLSVSRAWQAMAISLHSA